MERRVELLEEELNSMHEFRDVTFDQISKIMMSLGDWKRSVEKSETMKTDFLEQARQLALQEKKFVEDSNLLRQREKEFEVKIKRFDECCDELEMKEKELELIKIRIQDSLVEFNLREEQLNECNRDLILKKQELQKCNRELSLKLQKLGSVNMELEECNNEILLKQEDLSEVQKSLEKCTAELETECRNLGVLRKNFHGCSEELSINQEKLELVKKSLQEYSKNLEHKEKELQKVENLINKSKSELEWNEQKSRELQDLITSTSIEINQRYKELEGMQKSIKDCEKERDLNRKEHEYMQTLVENSRKEFDFRQEELNRIRNLIEERSKALSSKELEFNSINQLISDYNEELQIKEKQYSVKKKSVDQCSMKLKLKEEELELIEESLKKNLEKFYAEDEKLDAIQKCREIEEKKLSSLKESREYYEKINMKGQELSAIQISILEHQKELELEEELLKLVKSTIVETTTELMSMREQRMSIQKSTMECSKELELKQSSLDSIRKSLEDCCSELSSKELQQSVVQIVSCDYLRELQEQKTYFDSLNKTMEERLKKLQKEEKKLEGNVKKLEGNVKKLNSMKQRFDFREETAEGWQGNTQLAGKQTHEALVKGIRHCDIEQVERSDGNPLCSSFVNYNSNLTTSLRSSESLFSDLVVDHDLTIDEVRDGIRISPDPAKLVLDVMRESFFQFRNNGSSGFSTQLMRNVVLLLEQLMNSSPKVSSQVKEAALRQVLLWKDNLSTETQNSSEVLAFLMFLVIYDLVSFFKRDEILILINAITHYEQAPEICRALGFTNEIAGLTMNLIQRKQLLEAARFSHAFELSVKFLPETILTNYLQNTMGDVGPFSNDNASFEEQCNIIDKKAAAFSKFVDCVVDCRLEYILSPKIFMHYIIERQGMKTRPVQPSSAYPFMAQQSLHDQLAQQSMQVMQSKNQNLVGPSNSSSQQFFGPRKRSRLDKTVVEPYQGYTAPQYNHPMLLKRTILDIL